MSVADISINTDLAAPPDGLSTAHRQPDPMSATESYYAPAWVTMSAVMAHYRLYFMDGTSGHIERVEEFEAPDDTVAESALVGKLDHHALELWQGTRRVIRLRPNAMQGEPIGDVIFSLADGVVWASWPNVIGSIRLGPQEAVEMMMRDFLDQCALGRRLTAGGSAAE